MKFSAPLVVLAVTLALSSASQAGPPKVSLQVMADGLTSPVALTPLPDGRMLIVDQPGYVWLLERNGERRPEPALNLTNRLSPLNHGAFDERGVLDLALHPKFAANRRVFLTYTAPKRASSPPDWDCTLRLSEFTLPAGEPLRIDPGTEKVFLEIDKPFANHNSGRLAFGPEGLLFMGVGDGGNAHDQGRRPPTGNGQNLQTLLGKVLRLDVDHAASGKPYSIPRDNPFADGTVGLPEIYAYGLRNLWGLSFDRGGGHELFGAEVGQDLFEEVNIIRNGGNYGWSLREGFHGFDAKTPKTPPNETVKTGPRGEPLVEPILEYRHASLKKDPEAFGISITGGYVYRGKALPELAGRYVFGDWSRNFGVPQGTLLVATRPAAEGAPWAVERIEVVPELTGVFVVGFGQDNDGELYVMTNGSNGLTPGKGRVWKLVPAK
jgi:glucose/arabinose dehydrogenase